MQEFDPDGEQEVTVDEPDLDDELEEKMEEYEENKIKVINMRYNLKNYKRVKNVLDAAMERFSEDEDIDNHSDAALRIFNEYDDQEDLT